MNNTIRTLAYRLRTVLMASSRRLDGQSMVEYALLLVMIGTVVLVVLIVLGNQVHNVFNNVTCSLATMGGSCAQAPLPPVEH